MPDTPSTAKEYREALGAEWGTYVAAVPININGARAFNVGDPVPVSHVKGAIVDESQVKKTTTKAGQEIVSAAVEPKG